MNILLTRIGDGLRLLIASAVALALSLIVLLVFYQVITRYFTGTATPGLAEIARFLFIWLVFAGSAWLIAKRDLISIDFFSAQMRPEAQRWLMVFVDLCTAAMLIALLSYSGKLLDVVSIKRAPATGLPYAYVYLALPFFCLTGLYFIVERAITSGFYRHLPLAPTKAEG